MKYSHNKGYLSLKLTDDRTVSIKNLKKNQSFKCHKNVAHVFYRRTLFSVYTVQNGDSARLEEDGEIYRKSDETYGVQGQLRLDRLF